MGQELAVGDPVVGVVGKYKDFKEGVVHSFTPKLVRVRFRGGSMQLQGLPGFSDVAVYSGVLLKVTALIPTLSEEAQWEWNRTVALLNDNK